MLFQVPPEEAKQSLSQRECMILETDPAVTRERARVTAHFQSVSSYWDDIYRQLDLRSIIHQKRFDTVLHLVDQCSLPPGSHVLDLGCGAGVYSVALAKRGHVVEAVDLAPAMLERTRQHAAEAQVGERVTASVGDVYHVAFQDESFSLALAIGVIPWLEAPQEAIGELARVIKPGGYLVVAADNSKRLDILLDPLKSPVFSPVRRVVRRVFRISWWRWHPGPADAVCTRQHTVQELDQFLAAAGLGRVHAATLGFGPFTFFDHQFLPDWFGVKLHRVLQHLASLRCPGLQATGWQIVMLARKRASSGFASTRITSHNENLHQREQQRNPLTNSRSARDEPARRLR